MPPNQIISFSAQRGILGEGDSPLDPLLTSPVIPADRDQRFGVEFASVFGRWSLQSEWVAVNVHQIGGPPVFYHGGYVYASLFLTGEHRGYDLTKGAPDGVKVLRPFGVHGTWGNISWGGIGAWELAVRWGYLNLDDPAAPPAANGTRPGGIVEGFTIGLNWYLNDHSRFMLNFSPATLVNPNVGTSTAQFYGIRFAAFW